MAGVVGEGRDGSDSPNGGVGIGAVLERARTQRGLTLEEVEQATKIRKRYLAALEREDYGVMPDAVYVRGFFKTYANFLGLEGEGLPRQVLDRTKPRRGRGLNYGAPKKSGFERPLLPPGGVTGTERREVSKTTITLVVALLLVVGLLGALYRVGQNAQRADPARPEEIEDRRPTAARTGNVAGEDDGVAASGAPRVETEVRAAPSWLLARADGSTFFEGIAHPGFSRAFEAERLIGIKTGEARDVSGRGLAFEDEV